MAFFIFSMTRCFRTKVTHSVTCRKSQRDPNKHVSEPYKYQINQKVSTNELQSMLKERALAKFVVVTVVVVVVVVVEVTQTHKV